MSNKVEKMYILICVSYNLLSYKYNVFKLIKYPISFGIACNWLLFKCNLYKLINNPISLDISISLLQDKSKYCKLTKSLIILFKFNYINIITIVAFFV